MDGRFVRDSEEGEGKYEKTDRDKIFSYFFHEYSNFTVNF